MQIQKTQDLGMISVLHFECVKVLSSANAIVQTSCLSSLHFDASLAAISIGIGHHQSEELFVK